MSHLSVRPDDALLIVDIQNDFFAGGSLEVPEAEKVFPGINQLSHSGFGTLIATRDWHPSNHSSFIPQGGIWPPHCIAGTQGAEFSPLFDTGALTHIIHKGTEASLECYSAFTNEAGTPTGLAALLHTRRAKRLFICGITLDYCVKASVTDALKAGFDVYLVPTLCPSIGKAEPVLNALKRQGVQLATL